MLRGDCLFIALFALACAGAKSKPCVAELVASEKKHKVRGVPGKKKVVKKAAKKAVKKVAKKPAKKAARKAKPKAAPVAPAAPAPAAAPAA